MIETLPMDRRIERRLNITQWILGIMLLVVISIPVFASWWIARQVPFISTISVDGMQIIGETALCPGDALTYTYNFHAKGAGVLVRDRTLWQLSPPPKTIIYSTSRRFILTEPIDQHLTETWHVPPSYLNPETDTTEPLPTGDYALLMAISSPSRSTAITIASVNFTVEDCT